MEYQYYIPMKEGDHLDVDAFVFRVMKEMPQGAEITLNQLNTIAQVPRMFDLYEIVQKVLGQNFQHFKFTRLKDLGESVILKSYLR